jgi:WD40 repeat protein
MSTDSKERDQIKLEIKKLRRQVAQLLPAFDRRRTTLSTREPNVPRLQEDKHSLVFRASMRGHSGKVTACEWAGGQINDSMGPTLVSVGGDGHLMVWDAHTTTKRSATILDNRWMTACAVQSFGNTSPIVVGGLSNEWHVYQQEGVLKDCDGEVTERKHSTMPHDKGFLTDNTFMDAAHMVGSSSGNKCILWDIEHAAAVHEFSGKVKTAPMLCVERLSEHVFVAGSDDATMYVYDTRLASKSTDAVHKISGFEAGVSCLSAFNNGHTFASGSEDAHAAVIDLRCQNSVQGYKRETMSGTITSIAVSHSGRLLFLTVHNDILVFDTVLGTLYKSLAGFEALMSAVRVSPDGFALGAASWDGTLRVFA